MIDFQNYRTWLESTKHTIYPEARGESFAISHLRHAAVSIILVEKQPGEFSIIFGQRSQDVPQHKGQIAFPGGGIHKDENPLDAAIRETQEETGLKIVLQKDPHWILVGEYPKQFITISDFLIQPYVFIYKPNGNGLQFQKSDATSYMPDGYEILEVFDVPLSHLLDPHNFRVEKREWQGRTFDIHYYTYNDKTIWGVTGMLLFDFLSSLEPYLQQNN